VAGREGIEDIRARLNNIRSVEPLLGAMRTISLGSWQAALKRKGRVLSYTERLRGLLVPLVPLLEVRRRDRGSEPRAPASIVVVAIGSERGLCGAFNSTLAEYVDREVARLSSEGVAVELCALGARVTRALQRIGHTVASSRSLPMAALPSSDLASELTQGWLERFEVGELDAVQVMYHAYRNSTLYEPITVQLVPPRIEPFEERTAPWPSPYIDTDPIDLLVRVVVLWTTTELYRVLLDSAASEHSARYRLMEGATQNAGRLIDELTLALQAARQQAITAEMQELAVGAGLLGSEEG
jgi:F-type H+-transporting ATPase subunit gamma